MKFMKRLTINKDVVFVDTETDVWYKIPMNGKLKNTRKVDVIKDYGIVEFATETDILGNLRRI